MTSDELKECNRKIAAVAEGNEIEYRPRRAQTPAALWKACTAPLEATAGLILDIRQWETRIKPVVTYIPWTMADAPVGRVVHAKNDTSRCVIVGAQRAGSACLILLGNAAAYNCSAQAMLEHWIMDNGTPCGTKVSA